VGRVRGLSVPHWSASRSFAGCGYPPAVILVAVRWYLRYGLSYRDVEELPAEPGADNVTVYRWVQHSTPLLIETARPYRHATERCANDRVDDQGRLKVGCGHYADCNATRPRRL
jgi:transposase-like protein